MHACCLGRGARSGQADSASVVVSDREEGEEESEMVRAPTSGKG